LSDHSQDLPAQTAKIGLTAGVTVGLVSSSAGSQPARRRLEAAASQEGRRLEACYPANGRSRPDRSHPGYVLQPVGPRTSAAFSGNTAVPDEISEIPATKFVWPKRWEVRLAKNPCDASTAGGRTERAEKCRRRPALTEKVTTIPTSHQPSNKQ